jgi:microcystin-dependent protein
MAISENDTLFNLIGTTYGGDGQSTFALPNLGGRVPIHQGNGFILAESGGTEQVTLNIQQMAAHTHAFIASTSAASSTSPANALLAKPTASIYNSGTSPVAMAAAAIGPAGGSQPHENLQPYACINFIISLFGIYPSPT